MLEIHKHCRSSAALLLFATLPFFPGSSGAGILSQGNLNWPLSPLTDCPARNPNYILETSLQQSTGDRWPEQTETTSSLTDPAYTTITNVHPTTQVTDDSSVTAILPSQVTLDAALHRIKTSEHNEPGKIGGAKNAAPNLPDAEVPKNYEATLDVDRESDGDSPLDTANFLSFEDWKKQNLAKAGQSVENIGGRAGVAHVGSRRRPGNINNALDSIGDDTELEIDFSGFGRSGKPTLNIPSQHSPEHHGSAAEGSAEGTKPEGSASVTRTRNKDAGKTCKERFNYASFDCAATVLKTNKELKGSTSILVENKDSYLLNQCSADNKFFIVELCEDILVDTVVLANFEFFSSIFRKFRVSVSDRYPVKIDKWRELGTFEARNSREVQAFLVESPLIWARYLRVEFLTHYGNEYYCPVSLLRVHGTTMMEEFNHEMKAMREEEELEIANGEEDGEGLESETQVVIADALKEASSAASNQAEENATGSIPALIPVLPSEAPIESWQNEPLTKTTSTRDSYATGFTSFKFLLRSRMESAMLLDLGEHSQVCLLNDQNMNAASIMTSQVGAIRPSTDITKIETTPESTQTSTSSGAKKPHSNSTMLSVSSVLSTTSTSNSSHAEGRPSIHPSPKTASQTQGNLRVSTSSTQPPAANPTTQESFFKSVHKRLQLLESNSTLSLQYIEEQSRILRDAFSKVEKRQLAKTTAFLENLNSTVLSEMHSFRSQYDRIWQSTILELSSQREQSRNDVVALTARLSVLAEEIVFQKRMAILQFVLILLCFGLVLFSRGFSASSAILLQNVLDMSSAHPGGFESPRSSPSSTRPPSRYGIFGRGSSFTTNASEESPLRADVATVVTNGIREPSTSWNAANGPSIAYSPPTPTSSHAGDDELKRQSSEAGEDDSLDSSIEEPRPMRFARGGMLGDPIRRNLTDNV